MNELKENILWRALAGAQQGFATGGAEALRYAPGFPPLVAFADYARPNLGAIEPFCEPGEHLYCAGWSGASPVGWQVEAETSMFRMVWGTPGRAKAPPASRISELAARRRTVSKRILPLPLRG